jgi:hypothetical protein
MSSLSVVISDGENIPLSPLSIVKMRLCAVAFCICPLSAFNFSSAVALETFPRHKQVFKRFPLFCWLLWVNLSSIVASTAKRATRRYPVMVHSVFHLPESGRDGLNVGNQRNFPSQPRHSLTPSCYQAAFSLRVFHVEQCGEIGERKKCSPCSHKDVKCKEINGIAWEDEQAAR